MLAALWKGVQGYSQLLAQFDGTGWGCPRGISKIQMLCYQFWYIQAHFLTAFVFFSSYLVFKSWINKIKVHLFKAQKHTCQSIVYSDCGLLAFWKIWTKWYWPPSLPDANHMNVGQKSQKFKQPPWKPQGCMCWPYCKIYVKQFTNRLKAF